jgi:hypothetical protein
MKRHGVEAFWTREISKSGRLHYHLILTSGDTPEQAAETIKASIPTDTPSEVHVSEVRNVVHLSRYIVKARVKGQDDWGEWSTDKHKAKRVLFTRNCGLSKHGTIGKFWAKPLADYEREVAVERKAYRSRCMTTEAMISLATQDERTTARKLHDLTGEPTRRILAGLVASRTSTTSTTNNERVECMATGFLAL